MCGRYLELVHALRISYSQSRLGCSRGHYAVVGNFYIKAWGRRGFVTQSSYTSNLKRSPYPDDVGKLIQACSPFSSRTSPTSLKVLRLVPTLLYRVSIRPQTLVISRCISPLPCFLYPIIIHSAYQTSVSIPAPLLSLCLKIPFTLLSPFSAKCLPQANVLGPFHCIIPLFLRCNCLL